MSTIKDVLNGVIQNLYEKQISEKGWLEENADVARKIATRIYTEASAASEEVQYA